MQFSLGHIPYGSFIRNFYTEIPTIKISSLTTVGSVQGYVGRRYQITQSFVV